MPESKPPRTEDFLPLQKDLFSLAEAAQSCRGCSLYLRATQTVFGEGKSTARIVVVGEQPGDVEDVRGRPFVGPAGRILDKALAEASLDRASVYVTNAVKHFSFEERGKRRIHKKPRQSEVRACRPWLEGELDAIRPDVLVLLGATAAQAIFGPAFRVSQQRGKPIPSTLAPVVIATVHPSSILRAPDDAARELAFRGLVSALEVAARALDERRRGRSSPHRR
jgi:uracil-DNA glycosylase family protein